MLEYGLITLWSPWPVLHIWQQNLNWLFVDLFKKGFGVQTSIFGLEQEGGSLIAPMALAHPLHPIDNRSRNKRRNLWVGWCVSSWWPWYPSRSSVWIYTYIYMHSLYEFCYTTYIYIQRECPSVLAKLHPITFYRIVFLGYARFLGWIPLFVFFGLPIVSCLLIKV